MRLFLFLPYLLVSGIIARSQDFSYSHYDVKDGLAGSIVYCAAEDKEGFLWFGTEAGLSRFDGTRFKNFTTADGLPDNEVLKLYVDSKNRVWMVPFNNTVCYYWKGRIYNAGNDSILRRLSPGTGLTSIREDRQGNIMILARYTIQVITRLGEVKKNDSFSKHPVWINVVGGLDSDTGFVFYADSRIGPASHNRSPMPDAHTLSVQCNVYQLDMFAHIKFRGPLPGITYVSTTTILLSPGLTVYRVAGGAAFIPANGKLYTLPAPPSIISFSKIGDSLLTVNTSDGAIMYDLLTQKERAHFLQGQPVNDIIRDSEGNFWLMSAGNGIYRIGSLAFKNCRFPGNGNASVFALLKTGGVLLAGADKSALWTVDPSLRWFNRVPLHGFAPSFARVTVLQPIGKNRLLMGTDDNIIELAHLKVVPHRSLLGFCTKAVTRLTDSTWLVNSCNWAGLLHLPDFTLRDTLWSDRSTCSWKKDTLLYIGTLNGLYVIGSHKKPRFLGAIHPVFKGRIAEITETPDGVLWVATYGQGIAAYKNDTLLSVITQKDGLTSNICRRITAAGNEVWVGTDKGLNRIRTHNNRPEITRFTTADGLGSDMINSICVGSGNVYVGTAQGITLFNVADIAVNSFCRLRVTAVQTSSHTWPFDTCGFVLPHRENSVRIDFVGISFRSAGDISYHYRLLGLSNNWHTTRETFLSYPTLPSGQYELQLVAYNKFGVKSKTVRVLFTVEKQLQEKAWFIALMALIAGAGIWLLVSMRIRRIKKQNQEKLDTSARITELEQMALKAQMNPHFIFNSLNSIQQYVIDRDFKGVNKFITGFSRLIRLTLEMSSRSRVSIEEEIKYISTYLELEKSRFENKFDYTVDLASGIDPLAYHIPPMILQPYVENSIRHGVRNRADNDGKITISFVKDDQYLLCIIHDNGVGRSAAQQFKSQSPIEYQSRGMALTASRVEMINKINTAAIRIDIEDGQTDEGLPAGTNVIIRFPLQEIIKPTSIV